MQLARFARQRLVHAPTPLEPMPRLSDHLGGPALWVKRDDCSGLAGGGNKTRKLEFLLAEAHEEGADLVITAGGLQSNHARQTAAAAAKLGLECELVLQRNVDWRRDQYDATGNLFLDRLLNARITTIDGAANRDAALAGLAESRRAEGRRVYVIPVGGSTPTGALGYVACALELLDQANRQDLKIDALIHATSSGGTQAGLLAGLIGAGTGIPVIGIDVEADAEAAKQTVAELAGETAELLGVAAGPIEAAALVLGGYGGAGYGRPTPEMAEAVRLAARFEGLLLDPVYTGKAMAGLIGMIRQRDLAEIKNVVFLHTGGMPGLFAYRSVFD
jgi:L-cysteate sulfo-lyase